MESDKAYPYGYENAGDSKERQELIEKKRLDYFNTFYATEAGRRVLFDLFTYFQTRYGDGIEFAMANVALQEVYVLIKNNAGMNERDLIDIAATITTEERGT